MNLARILIVEDERIIAGDMQRKLQRLGYDVCASVASGEAAIEQALKTTPDLILMDIGLQGDMDGIETAQRLRAFFHGRVIFITAHSDLATKTRAAQAHPLGYLLKPYTLEELCSTVQEALEKLIKAQKEVA